LIPREREFAHDRLEAVMHGSERPDNDIAQLAACSVWLLIDRQPDIFARLSPEQRAKVMGYGKTCRLHDGETLFAQGNCHEGVYLIERGHYTSPAGREITLAYWQPGNIVGTPQVLGPGLHMWSGMAKGRTEVIAFRGPDLRSLMETMPALAVGLVEALEFKGKCLSALVQMLGTRSVSERLAMLLCTLAEIHGIREEDGVAIGPPFTHEAFAQMVGASRQWVTMTLDRFQGEGAIRIGKRRTVIRNARQLLAMPAGA
jgi:CRP/FNR family cyclic AMP-dependent transcriptional regulator